MNLKNLKSLFKINGCQKIYVKKLSPNDNSKNQVYFGGSFEILNILPISEIKTEEAGDWNKERSFFVPISCFFSLNFRDWKNVQYLKTTTKVDLIFRIVVWRKLLYIYLLATVNFEQRL